MSCQRHKDHDQSRHEAHTGYQGRGFDPLVQPHDARNGIQESALHYEESCSETVDQSSRNYLHSQSPDIHQRESLCRSTKDLWKDSASIAEGFLWRTREEKAQHVAVLVPVHQKIYLQNKEKGTTMQYANRL